MSKKTLSVLISIVLAVTMIVGSAAVSFGKTPPRDKIVIGVINPTTGVLAGFGEGTPWTEKLIVDFVNSQGGIYMKEYDQKLPIELIIYDSESDTTKCTALTQKLIQEDKVDLVVVRHTPETVNPVSAVCERFGMPCISLDGPIDAWLAEGPYDYVWHAHWNLDSMFKAYESLWKTGGFGPGTKIGILFANDADGTAWAGKFRQGIKDAGYVLVDPGQYPALTQDFSDIIRLFMKEGVEIVCGTNINPDFSTFWRQARQMGFKPKFVSMGKAFLLESDAMAIGPDLMDGLTCEVWWSPTHPFKSALTGETPASLAARYLADTGRKITQPMGLKYASMEIAVDVLRRAGTVDKEAIRQAIGETDLDTILCHIKYTPEHFAVTPLVGGQWVKNAQGGLDLVIIDNSQNPHIPTTGTFKPLSY